MCSCACVRVCGRRFGPGLLYPMPHPMTSSSNAVGGAGEHASGAIGGATEHASGRIGIAMRAVLQRVRSPKVRIKIAAFIRRECPHFLKQEGSACAGGAWEITKHWDGSVSWQRSRHHQPMHQPLKAVPKSMLQRKRRSICSIFAPTLQSLGVVGKPPATEREPFRLNPVQVESSHEAAAKRLLASST